MGIRWPMASKSYNYPKPCVVNQAGIRWKEDVHNWGGLTCEGNSQVVTTKCEESAEVIVCSSNESAKVTTDSRRSHKEQKDRTLCKQVQ